ncbi:MAG: hypothetical protein WBI31_07945 [Thermacetogeniaceae bacterium]|nr:hypothetical protein [Syntrophomonadaceae bacterium]
MEEKKCPQCRTYMEYLGVKEFRTGGKTGGWHLSLGDFAELQERIMKLEMWVCTQCRQVLFYLPDKSSLKSRK